MNQVSCNRILEAIKQDDLALFSALTDKSKNLLFGRFPLLSLCYLYNAKHIIKKFEPELLKVTNYNLVQENVEIYQAFKKFAGKALRLYIKPNTLVTPIEMAAILNSDAKVKQIYKNVKLSDESVKNLTKIYEYKNQAFSVDYNNLKLGFKPLSDKAKKNYKWGMLISFVLSVLFGGTIVLTSVFVGLATLSSPFKIYSQEQLSKALSTNGHYVLAQDVELTNFNVNASFNGVLDGAGHTLNVKGCNYNELISVNNGEIKNLSLKYDNIVKSLTTSFSFFVSINNGTISNVNLNSLNVNFNTTTQIENVLNISGVATDNNGLIENCKVNLSGVVNANGGGETFVGGVVANNNKTILGCEMVSGNIETVEADVAAICANNNIGAVINKCKNNASLKQTSSHNEWNPTVAGVVLTNWGKVANSRNSAALQVVSNNQFDNAMGSAILGGIVGYNYGEINHCKNTGNLKVETKNIDVYCGGVFANATYWNNENGVTVTTSEVFNCGSECEIDVTTEHEKAITFVGGVGGYLFGEIKNSFSGSTFKTVFDKDKNYVGTLLGATYYDYMLDHFYFKSENSNVVMHEDVMYHIGAGVTDFRVGINMVERRVTLFGIEMLDGSIITLSSINDLKELEEYYE